MSLGYNVITSAGYSAATPSADQRFNVVTIPQPVDVSGMEVESDVVDGLAAHATNIITLGVEDGGASGTGTTNIDTPIGGTGGFTADTPVAHTMSTSADDLDADDWVNFHFDEGGTPGTTGGVHVNINFVYGIPGGIA
jgi:hypothetical protein